MALTQSYIPADESVPLRDSTVASALREAAAEHGDLLALVEGIGDIAARRTWTFYELLKDAERVARALLQAFRPGDRIAVWSPNCPEWVLLQHGLSLAGMVMVTVNPAYRAHELQWALSQSRSAGLFMATSFRDNPMMAHLESSRASLPELRQVISFDTFWEFVNSAADAATELPKVSPSDPSQIQYTSGTTGFAKGAYLHHHGITNNSRMWAETVGMDAGSVFVSPMPLFHAGGCINGLLGPLQRGTTLVSLDQFDAGRTLELIETYGGTHVLGVPTMLIAMMEHPDLATRDLSSLHTVCSGGATVPAHLVRRIERSLGVQFSIVYGQTETSPVISVVRRDDSAEDKAATLGRPLPRTELKIVDPSNGEICPVDVPGELCVRGYLTMLGYFEMPEKTAETIEDDGWLHTGDLVSMDERGYLTITGRIKDMIIRGGENIYPREIEEVLFEHPKVAEVSVVGLPDDRWGEVVAAFIRDADPAYPATDAELHVHVRERLAPHKTPKHWFHIPELPMTAGGKVQKFAIVDNWKKGLYDGPGDAI